MTSIQKMILVSMFLLTPALTAHAEAVTNLSRYASLQNVPHIIADSRIQRNLQSLLGVNYPAFLKNFQHWAAPAFLKDGGLYVEGWRDSKQKIRQTSVFVIYPDGRIYAAYILPESSTVKYFTNASDHRHTLHPALRVWMRQFEQPMDVIYPKLGPTVAADKLAMLLMSPSDQNQLCTVVASIWSQSLADGWEMNEDVGNVASDATSSILNCSAAFSLVPKPVGFLPGVGYLVSNASNVVLYITGVKGNRQYKICVDTAARSYRSAIELASLGI